VSVSEIHQPWPAPNHERRRIWWHAVLRSRELGEAGVARTPEDWLQLLRQRKRGCTARDAENALRAWGFEPRMVRKEDSLWRRGSLTLTLPRPKAKHLKLTYVQRIIRFIERVKAQETTES
jgi:hypothetical protein